MADEVEQSGESVEAHRAMSLLLQAARIDSVLMDAARKVDRYLHDLESKNGRLRADVDNGREAER